MAASLLVEDLSERGLGCGGGERGRAQEAPVKEPLPLVEYDGEGGEGMTYAGTCLLYDGAIYGLDAHGGQAIGGILDGYTLHGRVIEDEDLEGGGYVTSKKEPL